MASSRRSLKFASCPLEVLAHRLRTPLQVQKYLREQFSYNFEEKGETLRSARSALLAGQAHCLEAALIAAAILEHQGYPPLVMSLESVDQLDHVVYVFKNKTGWGAIGRSRELGLHGRAPIFRSIRDLAWSYFDPFVDQTGEITGYGVAHLDDSKVDWRRSKKKVWAVERFLIDLKHQNFKKSQHRRERVKKLRSRYLAMGSIQSGRGWW